MPRDRESMPKSLRANGSRECAPDDERNCACDVTTSAIALAPGRALSRSRRGDERLCAPRRDDRLRDAIHVFPCHVTPCRPDGLLRLRLIACMILFSSWLYLSKRVRCLGISPQDAWCGSQHTLKV